MNRSMSSFDWIGEYLDWTQPDGWTVGANPLATGGTVQASAAMCQDFVAAYFDWMDGMEPLRAAKSPYRAVSGNSVGGSGDMAGLDMFEAALMAALRTESDCLQLLQRVLDTRGTPPRFLKFASRTLDHA